MRVLLSLRRYVQGQLRVVHAKRVRAVFAAVRSLLTGASLTLTSLGRNVSPRSSEKHGIKRIDRLLGNEALAGERGLFFAALARRILSSTRPQILIDWTEVTANRLCVLCATVAFDGRSIPIYAEAHPKKFLSNPTVEREFLRRLREVLPEHCRPILVMDAGFQGVIWQRILEMGWDFVVRIRKRIAVTLDGNRTGKLRDWISSEMLFGLATGAPRDLGHRLVTRRHRLRLRIIIADQRSPAARGPLSSFKRDSYDVRQALAAREPWLLVTSLPDTTAAEVTRIYRRRMQIEETFRDTKNPRFGWSLEYSGTRSASRMDVLLLIGAIATVVSLLVGLAAEKHGLQYRYQANTRRSRRVLSLVNLGRRLLRAPRDALGLELPALFALLQHHFPEVQMLEK